MLCTCSSIRTITITISPIFSYADRDCDCDCRRRVIPLWRLCVHGCASSDLYAFSTLDFSTTLLHASGEVPTPRVSHGAALMASDGTRVFVVGGCSKDARVDEILVHVFDTSMYVRFVNLSGQPSKMRTQRISNTRIPSVSL
jgi:hypothetical protein